MALQRATRTTSFYPGRGGPIWLIVLLSTLSGGCVSTRSFPMRWSDWQAIPASCCASPGDTRQWLRGAHQSLQGLLPDSAPRALLTEELTTRDGAPTDVDAHFGMDQRQRRSIFHNAAGLLQSALALRVDSTDSAWPDFADVQIPVNERLKISARLGIAERFGRPVKADCIVIVAGLLGDNALVRTRDLCRALRKSGLHTLAIEPRGYGMTLLRNPTVPSTFGVLETGDLLAIAGWLEDQPFVRNTGLVGFCWGANEALLTAWENGREASDPDVVPRLQKRMRRHDDTTRFRAGVIAFSPVLRFEEIIEQLEHRSRFELDPVLKHLGQGVRELMKKRHYPHPSGSLRTLFSREAAGSEAYYPEFIEDGLRYERLLPFGDKPVGPKLEAVRVPVLIVHAASDPLGSAQDVADLCSRVSNRRVAALILPGGGHNGFAVYNRAYYYNLVLNFFDPERGAAATPQRPIQNVRVSAMQR